MRISGGGILAQCPHAPVGVATDEVVGVELDDRWCYHIEKFFAFSTLYSINFLLCNHFVFLPSKFILTKFDLMHILITYRIILMRGDKLETIYEEHAKVFKAFCDEKRLRILELLRDGEKCACKLLENLDMGQSALSYHMKILVESGIVESRQEGKWTHYKISEKGSAYAGTLLKELTTPNSVIAENNCCKR